MFHFPYYENDEGTYMSQAWSLIKDGKLAPYTYWYDHAPAGWFLLAAWAKLTGGFFTFGTSINSGRVLMFLLHIGSAILLYFIARKLSRSYLAAFLAVLLFSLSPLAIYFQRRVLLDNIMIFWVLLSLALLILPRFQLKYVVLSALVFGIAVLTKETAIFFVPAFLYAIFTMAHRDNRRFALVGWISIAFCLISLYVLYAVLKSEFFPQGVFGNLPHVSLLNTTKEQLGRGAHFPFWNTQSDFFITLQKWLLRDSFTIILGIIAGIAGIILSIRVRSLRLPAFFAASYWLFLLRGKLVIDFYIVPLIPLLALESGAVITFLLGKVSFGSQRLFLLFSSFVLIALPVALIGISPKSFQDQYRRDETSAQIQAITWVKTHISPASFIVIDDYAYVDLHESRFADDPVFPHADWAWKVERDNEVKINKLKDDWKNIEYITLSHEILKQIRNNQFPLIKNALNYSDLQVEWKENSTSFFDPPKYISTNGDWMSIYQVRDKNQIMLDMSWKFYKENFIISYGQVIDPQRNNMTTSEGQSYALLRAVWLNDKDTFDGVWAWTKDHFQYRQKDKLFSWLWVKKAEKYELGDSATAADADEDIALALLFAYKKWGDEAYLSAAKQIIADIWKNEVVRIKGLYYLISGANYENPDGYLVNPSYLSPAAYRIFAEIDRKHPWIRLADDSYVILKRINGLLPPNWILINKNSGVISSAAKYIDKDADYYGYDAFRLMWRVALDALWFNNVKASDYLRSIVPFYQKEWEEKRQFSTIYTVDGERKTTDSRLSTATGAFAVFFPQNKELARQVYQELFEKKFIEEGYWGDKDNYYDQNWAWFTMAMFGGKIKNLWQ